MIKQFEVGKIYSMRSPCDQNCSWTYLLMKRTDKTLTFSTYDGSKKVCRVKVWSNVETCLPLGSYSMAPMLTAEKVI